MIRHFLAFYTLLAWMTGLYAEVDGSEIEFFEKRIRPVLAEKCYRCHSAEAEKLKAGLQTDHIEFLRKGGDSGPAIVAGQPDRSLLIESIRYRNPDLQMPPKSRLPVEVIADFEKWIAMGVPWPKEPPPARVVRGVKVDGSDAVMEAFDLEKRKASHWCWQPIANPEVPQVSDSSWALSPVDAFILSRLETAGLKPAADTEPQTWLRRVYFDLIGLPPSPEQIRGFLAAIREDPAAAYAAEVGRLLASPHFGERWARHWMDLARFAETCGHEFDLPIPNAWRYRNYLISALNNDVPYDRFLVEHLAGDLLEKPRCHPETGADESIVATGFWFLHEAVHSPTDIRGDEAGRIDNQIDVFGKAFLGITLACARCHDHKFDPIETADYYAIAGYLQSSRRQEAPLLTAEMKRSLAIELTKDSEASLRILDQPFSVDKSVRHDERFARYLELAHELCAEDLDPAAIREVAAKNGLDAGRLANWSEALRSDSVRKSDHPLYAIAMGADEGNRKELKKKLDASKARSDQFRADSRVLADFKGGDAEGWSSTGIAFSRSPAARPEIAVSQGESFLSPAGVWPGGRLSPESEGFLRSPTFELTHERIHLRMKARNVKVRLVIDGHYMNHFKQLLLKGTLLTEKQTDTGGRFQWLTMKGDLEKYVGHRVWLEISDRGDGYACLDEVILSNRDPPRESVSELNAWMVEQSGSLSEIYGSLWQECLDGLAVFQRGDLLPGHVDLINLVWKHDLWPRSEVEDFHRRNLPKPIYVTALQEGNPENERVHIRGSHKKLGEEVSRRNLLVFGGELAPAGRSGRRELAEELIGEENPLVRRVIVNRVWHHLFGRGIVPTVDDFGAMGQPPSHPELLDHLATRFSEDFGWSIKRLLRELVLSRTYRMNSAANPENDPDRLSELDPENVLLHRASVRRLQAEAIRDAILFVSGYLDPAVGGPSVPIHLTAFMEGRGRPKKSGPLDGGGRRSLYSEIRRNFLPPFLLAFDMPSPFNAMGRRSVSNVPAQALSLMNDPFVADQAEHWARRILEDQEISTEERIELLFLSAFGREASDAERETAVGFVSAGVGTEEAWADLCHALFNKKEFIFLN